MASKGTGSPRPRKRSGACTLLGRVSDDELLDLMRAAGAYASPALYEGFGIAPLEAMASGTPAVIAADSGGLVEVSGPAAIVVAERIGGGLARGRRAGAEATSRPDRAGLAHAAQFRWPEVAAATRAVLAEAAEPQADAERGSGKRRLDLLDPSLPGVRGGGARALRAALGDCPPPAPAPRASTSSGRVGDEVDPRRRRRSAGSGVLRTGRPAARYS